MPDVPLSQRELRLLLDALGLLVNGDVPEDGDRPEAQFVALIRKLQSYQPFGGSGLGETRWL